MTPPRRSHLRATAVLSVLLASMILAACGASNKETQNISEGEPVALGDLQYNLIFSRYLNAADNEDSAYLAGQPPVRPDGLYLGIFVQVQNMSAGAAALPKVFTIEDTSGAKYESIPSESLYALPLGSKLAADDELPTEDSTAQTGPIEGSLILFQIPQTATENRPLELVIPGAEEDATIELDL